MTARIIFKSASSIVDAEHIANELLQAGASIIAINHHQYPPPGAKNTDTLYIWAKVYDDVEVDETLTAMQEPLAWGVFHQDGGAHIYQQKAAAAAFGNPIPLYARPSQA